MTDIVCPRCSAPVGTFTPGDYGKLQGAPLGTTSIQGVTLDELSSVGGTVQFAAGEWAKAPEGGWMCARHAPPRSWPSGGGWEGDRVSDEFGPRLPNEHGLYYKWGKLPDYPRVELREYSPEPRPEPSWQRALAAVNATLTAWLCSPGDGPWYSNVTEPDGTQWLVTAERRDGWLDWSVETPRSPNWRLSGHAGRPTR